VILPVVSAPTVSKPSLKKLQVSVMMTVRDLAEKMEIKSSDVIKKLINLGIFATINQRLEIDRRRPGRRLRSRNP
jgi:translation initiation factor IF-2